jgi:hypothetical protein
MSLPDSGKPVEHSVPANTGYVRMMTLNPPPSFQALAAPKGYRPQGFKPEDASSSDSVFDTDPGNSYEDLRPENIRDDYDNDPP